MACSCVFWKIRPSGVIPPMMDRLDQLKACRRVGVQPFLAQVLRPPA
jgi:hypothetical protein